jgi:asparagine synthase (glutamine-hydrolysing)
MCGIAGFTFARGRSPGAFASHAERLARMTASLRHRGPDEQRGVVLDGAALGHARLAIVDRAGGRQPMIDPRLGIAVTFNGEIYNHADLRDRWRDYPFRTRSDTEVVLAGFVAEGIAFVRRLVGQFAFALFDPRDHATWLVRDRVGICPLQYTRTEDGWAFASEAKALFAGGHARARLDPRGISESVSLWAPVAPRTCFQDVRTLPPAHVARLEGSSIRLERYWRVPLGEALEESDRVEGTALARVEQVLGEAVRLCLRADVPVAAYLSGGLDSTLLCALAQRELGGTLRTFSIAFDRGGYDEAPFQREAARALGTRHEARSVTDADVAALLPLAVWHGEQVLVRSAPAPLLALSADVRAAGLRVVIAGEGADEFFWGYDLYKETKIRAFWARQPASRMRPLLLGRLYPYLPRMRQSPELLAQFFGAGLDVPSAPSFSHLPRWAAGARIARFFAPAFAASLAKYDPCADLVAAMPADVVAAGPLERAQHLEVETLLSGYLLSAQGDRMLLANGVEGRFPYLDHRVIEFACALPPSLKLRVLTEKYLLRRLAVGLLPQALAARGKQPYRAPIVRALTGPDAPPWSRLCLSRDAVDAVGVFLGEKVERLASRAATARGDEREADAATLVAVASTHVLHERFVRGFSVPSADACEVKVSAA